MRIAHVAPSAERLASGVQTAVEDLAKALGKRGHDVELWHVDDWTPPLEATTVEAMRLAHVRCRRLALHQRRHSLLPTVDLPSGEAVDVVHLHSVFVPSNTAIARTWRGALVVSPHGGYDPVSLSRSFFRKRVYSTLYEKSMVRRAATAVGLTDVEAAQVRAYAGEVVTAVVPNGVAPRPAGIGGRSSPHGAGVPPAPRLAVFVGRLDVRHKGLDRLMAATAAAPTWQFLFVGPDHRNGHQRLRRMAADLGTSARIHLVGQLDASALTDAYAAADLFVLPSRWEGLPMSLLEALAQGTPALVTPEVDRLVPVSRAGAGWVSAPGELGATLEAAAALPPAAWSGAAQAARRLARRYDWNDVAAAYEDVYRTAIRRWAARPTAVRGVSAR